MNSGPAGGNWVRALWKGPLNTGMRMCSEAAKRVENSCTHHTAVQTEVSINVQTVQNTKDSLDTKDRLCHKNKEPEVM